MMPDLAAEDLTEDAFLGDRLIIRQPRTGYRAGIDAVLLAAAAPVPSGPEQLILDCGAGVGTVGLCVAARVPNAQVTLIERDSRLSLISTGNIARNGLGTRVRSVTGDVAAKASGPTGVKLDSDVFDHVLANPPFHATDSGTRATDDLKAASHAMPEGELELWARFMARMAKPGGTATIIHKTECLLAVLKALEPRFGNLKILPIYPRDGDPAIRILVQGTKGNRAPLTLLSGLVLHNADNTFTPQATSILRHGAGLTVDA
jgi:tRNA1(Val) A37 N6-methylase TrmN6